MSATLTTFRSFAGNVAFSLLSLIAPLLFAFVATPYLIRGLGVEAYGYYSLVLAVIGFGFTTGLGRVAAKYIPENIADNQEVQLSRLLSAALLITAGTAIIEALLLALASPILMRSILNIPEISAPQLQAALYLACLIGPVMMLSQMFQSALQGLHLFRFYSFVTIAASLLLNIGSVALVITGFGYYSIFVWNLIVASLAGLYFLILFRKKLPGVLSLRRPGPVTFRKVGRFASSIFIYQSITSIFYLFERSFVIRNYGAEALTYYSVPLMLGIYLHGLIFSFSQVAIPKLNESISRLPHLLALYKIFTKIVVSLAVFFVLMYLCLGNQLLSIWLGSDFAGHSYRLLVIHGIAYATIAVSIVCWILAEASHRSGINAFSSTATSLVGIAFAITFAASSGPESPAIGRLIGAAIVLPLIGFLETKVFGEFQLRFWFSALAKVSIAAAAVLTIAWILAKFAIDNWFVLVLSGTVLSVVYWGFLWVMCFLDLRTMREALSNTDREQMQNRRGVCDNNVGPDVAT